MHPRAAHLAQVGGAPRIEAARALLRPRQQIRHVGRRDHAVRDDAQRGELIGAVFAGAFGHHRRAIPVQDRAGAIDGAQPGKAAFQLGIGIVGDHVLTFVRPAIGEPAVLPVIGEIDAGQRRGDQEPGDGVLQVIVGDVEPGLAAHRHAAGVGAASASRKNASSLGSGLRARHAAHQRHVDMEPDIAVGRVVRRELALLLVAPHDAGELDRAGKLALGATRRVLLLLGNETAVEQHDPAVGGLDRRDDLQADGVLEAARGEVELLVVQEAAGDLHASVLVAQRIALQQLVERERRRRLVDGDAVEDVALPLAALHLPDAESQRDHEDRQRDERGPQSRPQPDHGRFGSQKANRRGTPGGSSS